MNALQRNGMAVDAVLSNDRRARRGLRRFATHLRLMGAQSLAPGEIVSDHRAALHHKMHALHFGDICSGFPETAMMSANLPFSIVPMSFSIP